MIISFSKSPKNSEEILVTNTSGKVKVGIIKWMPEMERYAFQVFNKNLIFEAGVLDAISRHLQYLLEKR